MNQNEKTLVVTSFVTIIMIFIVVVIVFLVVPQSRNNFVESYNTKTKLFNDNNFIQQQI